MQERFETDSKCGIAVIGLFLVAGLVGFYGWAVFGDSLPLAGMSGTAAALLLCMVITPMLAVLLMISLRRQGKFKLQAPAEQQSRFSDRLATFDHMLDHMNQGVMLISRDGVVEVSNRRACDLLQLPPDMMATQPGLDDVLAFQWRKGLFERATNDVRVFIRKGGVSDHLTRYERGTTDGRTIEVLSVPISGGGTVRTVTDITERR